MKFTRRGSGAVGAALLITTILGPATVQAAPPDDGIAFTRHLDRSSGRAGQPDVW
jgi:hypothetical protein